jgi:hypothetical protein
MSSTANQKRRRRTPSEIQEILHAQRESGLPVLRFCTENGYSYSTFHLWRSRFAKEQSRDRAPQIAEHGRTGPFCEVKLVESRFAIGPSARIHTRSGHCVEVSLGRDPVDGLLELLGRLQ